MVGLVWVTGSQPAPPNAVRSYGIRSTPPPPDDCAPAGAAGPIESAPAATPSVSARTSARERRAMSCPPRLLACRTPPDPALSQKRIGAGARAPAPFVILRLSRWPTP